MSFLVLLCTWTFVHCSSIEMIIILTLLRTFFQILYFKRKVVDSYLNCLRLINDVRGSFTIDLEPWYTALMLLSDPQFYGLSSSRGGQNLSAKGCPQIYDKLKILMENSIWLSLWLINQTEENQVHFFLFFIVHDKLKILMKKSIIWISD